MGRIHAPGELSKMQGMGRPCEYTREIGDRICEALSMCGSLRAVCREEWAPDRGTVMRWVVDDIDGFAARYARAKSMGIDEFVEETLEIADDGSNDWMRSNKPDAEGYALNGEHVQRSKVRIETRRWLAERLEPKKYGVKAGLDLTSSDGSMTPVDTPTRAARVADLMAQAAKRAEATDDADGLV